MIIAIDYDKTYTGDPKLFELLIYLILNNGHTIVCG